MKRSAEVTLTLVAAIGMAGCGRERRDPCDAAAFSEEACREAVQNGGYYWYGSWVPMRYSNPYPYYYDRSHSYAAGGGVVSPAPGKAYGRTAGSGAGVVRGGFGSTGGGHGAGE